MDTIWFKERKRALKLTDQVIADAIGRERSVANRILAGKVGFEMRLVAPMASLFQVSRAEILHRAGVIEADEAAALGETESPLQSNAVVFDMEGASLKEPRANLPVHGTALGSARKVDGEAIEQTTLNKSETIEYAMRPPLLNKRLKAYGLYVQGSSMHPALPDGELVAVVPDMPLSIGDNVVVYLRPENPEEDDGQTARAVLIKELVRRSADRIVLRQYTPPADFAIDMEDVVRVDRVLTRREMLS